MVQDQTFDTGAVTINYVAGPTGGPPLVLLHGITGWWQSWLPVMPDLALRWRLFALDLRGHGRSGRAAGAYALVDYADDVIAFLRQVTGEPHRIVLRDDEHAGTQANLGRDRGRPTQRGERVEEKR